MKFIKYLLPALALLSMAACEHDPDEIVYSSSDPVITKHGNVAVNDLTVDEDFTLVWSAANFGYRPAETEYTVSAALTGDYVTLGTVVDRCSFTCRNSELFDALGIRLTGSYDVSFRITAVSGGESRESEAATVHFDYSKITYLWILGDYQGWSADNASSRLFQYPDGMFRGFVQLPYDGGMKFTSQPGWEGTNYGAGETEGTLSTSNEAGNITAAAGLYYIEADVDAMSYVMIPLESVSLIGEAVGGWDADVDMSFDAASGTWKGIANAVSGKEYKVRFNHAWNITVGGTEYDCSLGGDAADLAFKGSNLSAASDGITCFTLSLFDYPYSISEGGVEEADDVLYIANSGNGWNYFAAPKMQPANVVGPNNEPLSFWGLVDMPEAGEILFARLQSPLGTRFGGSASALEQYAGGEEAQPIAVGKGLNYVYVSLAEGQMQAVIEPVSSVGMVGAFNGWNAAEPAEFTYDAGSQSWTLDRNFGVDGEYKIIFNHMWNKQVDGLTLELSLGQSNFDLRINGGNLFMPAGDHSLVLDLARTPFTMATDGVVADFTALPDAIGVTGDFGGYNWKPEESPMLAGNPETGIYTGYLAMYGATYGFKFTYSGIWVGGTLIEGTTYGYTLGGEDNMAIPDGLYVWTVDLKQNSASAVALNSVSLIGDAVGGWEADVELVRDEADGLYKATVAAVVGEYKVRFDNGWAENLGGDVDNLVKDGANLTIAEAGNYEFALDLTHTPYKLTVTAK